MIFQTRSVKKKDDTKERLKGINVKLVCGECLISDNIFTNEFNVCRYLTQIQLSYSLVRGKISK